MRVNWIAKKHQYKADGALMFIQKICRTLVASLSACLLAATVAGCGSGGGGGDQAAAETPSELPPEVPPTPSIPPTPVTGDYVEIQAVPGAIVAARVGEIVVLDDSKSYAKANEPLSYRWSFSYLPDDSQAVLQGETTATPTFVADVRGVYMVQLVVSAEGVSSERAITSVIVTDPTERPTDRTI